MQSNSTTLDSAQMSIKMTGVDSSANTMQSDLEGKPTMKTNFITAGQDSIDYRPSCNGYKILKTLGKGGNGVVKLVEKNGHEFAMKIFEPHPSERANFCKETQTELNLVQQHQIDDIPEYYEFVENTTWQKKDGTNV